MAKIGKIHGLHHIGFTVPNMEQAIDFFSSVFGAVTIMECGSVDVNDAFMAKYLGVPEGLKIVDQRVIQIGRGSSIELFEYSGLSGEQHLKHNGEVGAMHIAFEVDNAFEVAKKMREIGVDVLEGPTLIKGGPMDNLIWLYFRSPWGQYLEIVSANGPLGYETEQGPKLWTPNSSA